jgi:hypothetical protein
VQILWRHAVVLAFDLVAQAAKEAFHHVRVLAVVAVNLRVVHAVNVVAHVSDPLLAASWRRHLPQLFTFKLHAKKIC